MIKNLSSERALRTLIAEAASILEGVGEAFWSRKLRSAIISLDVAEILSWYGGMGSFNDVIVAAVNGHRVKREQEQVLNAKLDELRRRIYELANSQ